MLGTLPATTMKVQTRVSCAQLDSRVSAAALVVKTKVTMGSGVIRTPLTNVKCQPTFRDGHAEVTCVRTSKLSHLLSPGVTHITFTLHVPGT